MLRELGASITEAVRKIGFTHRTSNLLHHNVICMRIINGEGTVNMETSLRTLELLWTRSNASTHGSCRSERMWRRTYRALVIEMFISQIRIFASSLVLWLGLAVVGQAASFDCNKATTETEKAICADTELSKFDEEIAKVYFSIKKSGRYCDGIVENQSLWVGQYRELHGYDFGRQLWYLRIMSTMNECAKGDADFETCYPDALEEFSECQAEGDWTTYIIDRCGSSLNDALSTILMIETDLWRQINSFDSETLELFNVAEEKWNDFLGADCDWQFSEYRDFSKRGQIWLDCLIGHKINRIVLLNSSNRFQGKDVPFLNRAE